MRHFFGHSPLRLAVLAALGACASAATQRAYIAPSSDTITSDTDVRSGDPPTHVVTIYNRSSVPVTIWNISLEPCENVRLSCAPRRTNIRIGPGQSVMAARIEPETRNKSFSYHFHYSWRPDSSTRGAAITALASVDPNASGALRELTPTDFRTLSARIAKIRPSADSAVMQPGDQLAIGDVRIHVLDARDSVLGYTRWVRWHVTTGGGLQVAPPSLIARRPARGVVRFSLAAEAQGLLTTTVPDVDFPIVVAFRFDPDGPVFKGRALDADTRTPLGCARVGIEDSAQNVVNSARADAAGAFGVKAPRPGAYRVRVETNGWAPWYAASVVASASEEKTEEHLVRFTEQLLVTRNPIPDPDRERARPASVRFEPNTTRTGARAAQTPVIQGVTLAGTESMPILNIASPLQPQTLWTQFTVDTAGRIDTTSIVLPAGTAANARASVRYVLPRVRFTPARDFGKPTCDLVRLQINLSPR